MRRTILLLTLPCLLLLQCTDEEPVTTFTDPRDGTTYPVQSISGTDWLAADLSLRGQEFFTYNQALLACPDGWRLPDQEEWHQLLVINGGYVDGAEQTGDNLSGAYDRLTSTLNFIPDEEYWGGGPYWQDVPSIRNDVIRFNSGELYGAKEIIKFGSLRATTQLRCRCVKDTDQNVQYVSLKTDSIDNLYRYGIARTSAVFYRYEEGVFVPTPEMLVMTGLGELPGGLTDNFYYMEIPLDELKLALSDYEEVSLETNIAPLILITARHKENDLLQVSTASPDEHVRLIIHFYENDVLEAEVTGHFGYPRTIEITNLTFKVNLAGL